MPFGRLQFLISQFLATGLCIVLFLNKNCCENLFSFHKYVKHIRLLRSFGIKLIFDNRGLNDTAHVL